MAPFLTDIWLSCLLLLRCGVCTFAGIAQSVPLAGAGAPSFYSSALFSYRFVQPAVQATFNGAIVTSGAFCRLLNYSKECAATDTALPHFLDWGSVVSLPAPTLYQQYPDLQLYPATAYAIAPVYNLKGISNLILTVQTLAKIWSGRITTWDHPDIVASNRNFSAWNIPANQSIALVARLDSAGATPLFKKVLGAADATFPISAANWNGLVKPVVSSSGFSLVSYVLLTPYSLGYTSAGDVLGAVPIVKLNRSGIVVECNTASVQYALLEKGLSFGNNGDDPAHLTGDISNAVNPLAWPAVLYSYIAVRKSTLRPGATCETVTALVNFWVWFWSSNEVAALGNDLAFVALPEVVRDLVLARFQQDISCGGQRVWQAVEVPVVSGYGPEFALTIFEKFQQAYELVNSSVVLNYTTLVSDDASAYLQAGGFQVSTTPPASTSGVYSLVLGVEAVVAISTQTALVLDGLTLAKVLNGDIKTWLHADILALNPGGIRSSSTGRLLNDTTQRIVLLQGPTASSAQLTALLQRYYPTYTGAAIQAVSAFSREALLWSGVVTTPYALSITPLVGTLPNELQLACIVSSGGVAVAPSLAAAKACTSSATYSAVGQGIALSSANSSCYPLLLPLYVNARRQCPPSAAMARTVVFLEWMFTKDTLVAALDALNLVSLYGVSDAIQTANDAALFELSCQVLPVPATSTDIVPLLLAVIIPIGVVLLLGLAGCGGWLWRVTESNRALRKKFSNDNVAESCAEAIARFDLETVAWLQDVKAPNKIQLAFLAIIALLTEVKPYIPDQLLSRLTANKAKEGEAGEADGEEDAQSQPPSPVTRDANYRERQPSSVPSPTNSRSSSRLKSTVSSADSGARHVQALRDWRRKRCTYLAVRFGSTHPQPEKRLPGLVQLAGRIVDVAKANGATIDAVGLDFVGVHWGVSSMSGGLATRAVQASLEMLKLPDALPEDQRAAVWLQAGVGKGVCDCGTVSSESGHRFFVVFGPEATLAAEIATDNLPRRVAAAVLVTAAVYQEVQYTVHCMPRLWHGDALLWEPLGLLKKNGDDEWMYELQDMNEDIALSPKVLLEAFMLAKGDKKAPSLRTHVTELRTLHGNKLSVQDRAALDVLLAPPNDGALRNAVPGNL